MCVCVALFLSPLSLFKRIVSLCQPQGYARNKGSQPVSIQGSQRVCAAQIQTKTGHTYSLTSSLTQSRTHSLTHSPHLTSPHLASLNHPLSNANGAKFVFALSFMNLPATSVPCFILNSTAFSGCWFFIIMKRFELELQIGSHGSRRGKHCQMGMSRIDI